METWEHKAIANMFPVDQQGSARYGSVNFDKHLAANVAAGS
jgi:hypothetical protein